MRASLLQSSINSGAIIAADTNLLRIKKLGERMNRWLGVDWQASNKKATGSDAEL
eukprot:COSAG02_NODE_1237_length_13725_cov_27.071921_18_plen_55_part_00